KRALDAGDLDKAIRQIDMVFSTIPHQIFENRREGFFHAVLHLTFQGLGLLTESEVSTNVGRVDTVVHAKSGIYVMEFKLDGTAEAALDQIREKQYATRWLGQGKPVTALGISFSSETRTVAEWKQVGYE
ncbi:MAG: PD-(D/E)XK nuclease domain-containing protein, partial [Bacteroidia bacterium]|nr:PD-(D/E)XK nuclease domain-containing protein [Bacteroidia bacterium]